MSDVVEFFAAGIASTKGSARAFVRGGRAIVTNNAGVKAKAWHAVVAGAAMDAMQGRAPHEGAVEVEVVFHLARPQAHRRSNGALKAGAPHWQSKKPDIDKLARCLLDALTGVVLVDDALIARLVVEKRYGDSTLGATVRVRSIVAMDAAGERAA